MIYKIQQRIETLNENAINAHKEKPSFTLEDITFTHWDFNHRDGWTVDAWLAETDIEAANVLEAFEGFSTKMNRIIPRIAFVGQSYIEAQHQPALAIKSGSDIAFFYDPFDSEPVGLMFMEGQLSALTQLMSSPINEAFFKYWNSAVNTIGYAPKLLIMFSAIEAFAKKANGQKDWNLINDILGEELKDKIFKPRTGLRHRLTHGEYFGSDDSDINYVEAIHKAFMKYFNEQIFNANLLTLDVIHPHRHLFGNKNVGKYFIKARAQETRLNLKDVLADFNANRNHKPAQYDYVFDKELKLSNF